jgi:hypothetical protein
VVSARNYPHEQQESPFVSRRAADTNNLRYLEADFTKQDIPEVIKVGAMREQEAPWKTVVLTLDIDTDAVSGPSLKWLG